MPERGRSGCTKPRRFGLSVQGPANKTPPPAIQQHTAILDKVHRLFDHPFVFNIWQAVGDSGKGRQIRRFLRGVPFSSVLDVGCGTGNWASVTDGRYLGVDISPEFIAAARDRYRGDPQKEFRQLDATSEDVLGHFDLMQLISVLHHFRRTGAALDRPARSSHPALVCA